MKSRLSILATSNRCWYRRTAIGGIALLSVVVGFCPVTSADVCGGPIPSFPVSRVATSSAVALPCCTPAPTAVPEPLTIIGTIVGGAAAFRPIKELKVDPK